MHIININNMKIRHGQDHKKPLLESKFTEFALMLPVIVFAVLGIYYVITMIVAK